MPLFWKEWRSAKWWSVLVMGMFLVMFLGVNQSLQEAKQYSPVNSTEMTNDRETETLYMGAGEGYQYFLSRPVFMTSFHRQFSNVTLFLAFITIIFSTLLFHNDRKENIGAFISSLPFTKKAQFKAKWMVGALVITIPFLISLILAILLRAANWGWIEEIYNWDQVIGQLKAHDSLRILISYFVQTYVFFIAFYSFLMCAQTLIGNNIVASIVGCIVPVVPMFLLSAIGPTMLHLTGIDIRGVINSIGNNYDRLISFYGLMHIRRISDFSPNSMGGEIVYANRYGLEISILLVIIVVSTYFGLYFYSKNDNSRNGYIPMFPWVGKVLVIGVTVCSALLGNNLLREFVRETSIIYEILTLGLSGIVGYIVIRKMITILGGEKNA